MLIYFLQTNLSPEGVVRCATTPLYSSKCQGSWQNIDLPNLTYIHSQFFVGINYFNIFNMVKYLLCLTEYSSLASLIVNNVNVS